jgi:hypothetical protein
MEFEVCKYYPIAQILKNISGNFLSTGLPGGTICLILRYQILNI